MKRDHGELDRIVSLIGACRICQSRRHLDPHHIVPRSVTQCDEPANIVVLCRKCHDQVHRKQLDLGIYLTAAEGAKAVLLMRTVHAAHKLLYPSEYPSKVAA